MANFNIDYLVVAGGGGGGGSAWTTGGASGGGGGGGEYLYQTSQSLLASTPYSITVGSGGAASGNGTAAGQGSDSIFNAITVNGGGRGGSGNGLPYATETPGGSGGSGGGGGAAPSGNTPASGGSSVIEGGGLGFAGGSFTSRSTRWGSGGGGGAGSVGANGNSSSGGDGGNGASNSITGTNTTYAGGGGGGTFGGGTTYAGTGGTGGGGDATATTGSNGANNKGAGGGGGSYSSAHYSGGTGGSGIVILRYATADVAGYTTTGLTPTKDTATISGQTILSFTTVGTGTITFTPLPLPITPFDGTKATTPVTGFNKTGTSEGLKLPSGTNTNQPIGAFAEQGMIRNDTEETVDSSASAMTHYNGTNWRYFAATESPDNPNLKMNLDASNTASYPGTGTAWFDLTSNANNGAISGATWDTNGYFDFDGSNDYVNVPDNDSLEWTTSKSLSVWVNSNNSSGNKGIVAKTTNASPYGWILQQDGGNVKFWFASGGIAQTTPATTLPLNTWTHIAVTYNGSSLLMYKNGVLVSTLNTSLTPALSSSPLTIGRYYGNVSNYYFNGQISKVNVYDTALTSTEVNTLFLEGKGF